MSNPPAGALSLPPFLLTPLKVCEVPALRLLTLPPLPGPWPHFRHPSDAIMTSLRAQLWRSIAPLMVPLAGWHPVYRHSPCTWALVTCNDERHIVKM